ncbi:hypothetical protein BC940DRAFT_306516 [Gongronella butleri]|nr:hypothetical protein BC940DRAFT_306516 [Gongronella butleri]
MDTSFECLVQDADEALHLWNATRVIQTAQDEAATRQALRFLRQRATRVDEREAKMKLSLVYADGIANWLPKDTLEAAMWAKSLYDKQLAAAIAACAPAMETTDSLRHLIDNHMPLLDDNGDEMEQNAQNEQNDALYLVGLVLVHGDASEKERIQGMDALTRAATRGHGQAAYELGRLYSDRYMHQHTDKDPQKSLQWFHTAWDLGETRALVDLAYGYYEGDDQNDKLAFQFAKQGAEKNDRYCQYIYGHLFLKGRGTPQNALEAVKWLQCSADQGFAEAMEELAIVYLRGHGNVAQDYPKAYAICQRGAALPHCQTVLADLYRHGWGVNRDYQTAFKHYQLAACHTDPSPYAQHMLGEMYEN